MEMSCCTGSGSRESECAAGILLGEVIDAAGAIGVTRLFFSICENYIIWNLRRIE